MNEETLHEEAQVVESPTIDGDQSPTSEPTSEPQKAPETGQQLNFRRLKEEKERLQRERDELARMIQQQKSTQSEDPDDLADKKYVKEQFRYLHEQLIETRIKSQYPDFEAVVNNDNIEVLKSTYPELADSLSSSPDLYKKAVSAYTLIKKLGIGSEDSYKQDKDLAQKNAAKPKPLVSVAPQQGESPLSRANAFAHGLTPELKAQLWKETQEARKNS